MANVLIRNFPTTASSTASDDYIAIDGTTNGTRKLSAYNPTFGGRVTVSSGATTTGQTDLLVNPTTKASGNLIDAQVNGASKFLVNSLGSATLASNLTVGSDVTGTQTTVTLQQGATYGPTLKFDATNVGGATSGRVYSIYSSVSNDGVGGGKWGVYDVTANASRLEVDSSGNVVVKSTTASVSSNTGALVVGNGTSGGLGVNGAAFIGSNLTVGGIESISNTASTSSYQTGLRLQSAASSAPNTMPGVEWYSSALSAITAAIFSTRTAVSYASSLTFQTLTASGTLTTALTLDSSQNATFGGGTITAGSGVDLTLSGGSSGASLALGQGSSGIVTATAAASSAVFDVKSTSTFGYSGLNFLSSAGTSSGGVGFGNSATTYFPSGSYLWSSGSITLATGGVSNNALVIDSSKNAVFYGKLTVATGNAPASASASGTTGTIAWDSSYVYVCTATNTWKRAALATW